MRAGVGRRERFPNPCVVPSKLFPVTRFLTAGFKGVFFVNCWACGGIVRVQLEKLCDPLPGSGFHPIDSSFEEEYIGASGPSFLELRDRTAAAVNQVPQITPKREEVDDGRADSTGPGWPAESRAGFCSVMLAGSLLAVPHGTTDQPDSSPTKVGELTPA